MARILITEDEDSLRAFVARALRMDGHETVEAADGAEGLEALDGGRFDLLLSDIRMPVMDGIELTHKASAAHPALKILLMTGYAEQRERADDLAEKIVDVVSKPFSLPDIRTAVAKALAA
jgi:two-component system, cell cycle response regulator CpdR